MRLLLVAVAFGLLQTVSSVPRCIRAQSCYDEFKARAIAADDDEYWFCVALRAEFFCLENVKVDCTPEQAQWIENDIRTAKERNPKCDAVAASSITLTAMIGLSLLNYLFSRH